MAPKIFKIDNNKVVSNNSSRTNKIIVNLSKNNKFERLMYMPNIKAIEKSIFLISNTKKAFNYLRQTFIKALILQYFNFKSFFQIEINVSVYIINRVLSQLNLNSYKLQNQWHPIAYFSRKMIFAET